MGTTDNDLSLSGLVEERLADLLRDGMDDLPENGVFTACGEDGGEDGGTPCLVVMADAEGTDPPLTNIWRHNVSVELRAADHELDKAEFSRVFEQAFDLVACAVASDLTTDDLKVWAVEMARPLPFETDDGVRSRKVEALFFASKVDPDLE